MVALKFDSVATQGIPESRTMDPREWSKTRTGCANLLGINNIIHFHLNETTALILLKNHLITLAGLTWIVATSPYLFTVFSYSFFFLVLFHLPIF